MNKYNVVKDVIDKWDPIGLLELGCPDDEYDPEIQDIVVILDNTYSINDLALEIQKVFIKWFDEELPKEECHRASMKLWNKVK